MTRQIIWQRWHDPLRPLLKNWSGKNGDDNELAVSLATFDDGDGDDTDERDNPYDDPDDKGVGPGVIGPMGVVPLRESNIPSKLFNFWMGHANFRITQSVQKSIANVDGVESLDVFSPYRFRISVGLAFKADQVKRGVELAVQPPPEKPPAERSGRGPTERILSKSFPFWAIGTVNGKKVSFGGATKEDVESQIVGLDKVVTSW